MPFSPSLPSPSLHLLLPFALPALASLSTEWADLEQSALGELLRRATLIERIYGEDSFQRTLSHERWLARAFNLTMTVTHGAGAEGEKGNSSNSNSSNRRQEALDNQNQAPFAPYMLLADGGVPEDKKWACVQPVHIHIAHDHLVLADPQALELSYDEAAALLNIARPLIEEFGLKLIAPTPWRWYLSGDALGELSSASPFCAIGRNIEIWLPHDTNTGERSQRWMKLQNEVQMAWFEHPINRAREMRGADTANSIWLSAQGVFKPVARPFIRVLSTAAATRGLALAAQIQVGEPPNAVEIEKLNLRNDTDTDTDTDTGHPSDTAPIGGTLIELDTLIKPLMLIASPSDQNQDQDQAALSAAFASLEQNWFAPALDALKNGRLSSLTLTLCGDTDLITMKVTRADLRKFWFHRMLCFWRRRTFAALLFNLK